MLISAELRWFYPGPLPRDVALWFQADALGQDLDSAAAREDVYLNLPACPYLGIKLREERLEIKLRQQELGGFKNQVWEGKAEKWCKWSCDQPTAEPLVSASAIAQGPWIKVIKKRMQRKYQVLADQSLQTVAIAADIEHGCTAEVSQVEIQGHPWWSLAFEAFGPDPEMSLQTTAHWLLKGYSGPQLHLQDSYAYPKWLAIAMSPKATDLSVTGFQSDSGSAR